MSEFDEAVEGYPNLFWDRSVQCYIIYVMGGGTFIEVCGQDRIKVARKIHDLFYPPTPADIKTVY